MKYIVQDLYSTDPREHVLVGHADYTAPIRQHELDHTDHTDHTARNISALKYPLLVDHELGIEVLSGVRKYYELTTPREHTRTRTERKPRGL